MTARQKLKIEQSTLREAINALLFKGEAMTAEERAELDKSTTRIQALEGELRAAISLDGDQQTTEKPTEPDSEGRELVRMCSEAKVSTTSPPPSPGGRCTPASKPS